ncbi:MAG: RNA recognition motif domain-containing protein [Thermoflexales bacterium]
MSNRIYVGNLAYSTTDVDLRNFFATVGEVKSAEVVMDRISNRSKGFGFVEMVNDEDANRAVQTLNGRELDNRQLRIDFARPREERPRLGGSFSSGFSSAAGSARSTRGGGGRRDDRSLRERRRSRYEDNF